MAKHRKPGRADYGKLEYLIPSYEGAVTLVAGFSVSAALFAATEGTFASPETDAKRITACANNLPSQSITYTKKTIPGNCKPFEMSYKNEGQPISYTFPSNSEFTAVESAPRGGISEKNVYFFLVFWCGGLAATATLRNALCSDS